MSIQTSIIFVGTSSKPHNICNSLTLYYHKGMSLLLKNDSVTLRMGTQFLNFALKSITGWLTSFF